MEPDMAYHSNLTRMSFESALTPESLQVTRLIQLALVIGVLIYALCVGLIYLQNLDLRANPYEVDTVSTLTILHLAFLFGALGASRFLSMRIFSPGALSRRSSEVDPGVLAAMCVTQQRNAIIVRLAALEGAALFGLAVCTIAVMNGTLQASPHYWINMASTVVLLLYGVGTFPTKERLVSWFERSFIEQ
jgi:F0F1-type ATP synthase membrane subunit c/vacuolar-type H+-ATPase subunit K